METTEVEDGAVEEEVSIITEEVVVDLETQEEADMSNKEDATTIGEEVSQPVIIEQTSERMIVIIDTRVQLLENVNSCLIVTSLHVGDSIYNKYSQSDKTFYNDCC